MRPEDLEDMPEELKAKAARLWPEAEELDAKISDLLGGASHHSMISFVLASCFGKYLYTLDKSERVKVIAAHLGTANDTLAEMEAAELDTLEGLVQAMTATKN